MNRVGEINNPNPIIDKKVKHFYDYFNYILSNQGDKTIYRHENHLTILERILFRLQNFEIKPSTNKLIKSYLDLHPLFNTDSDIISRKGEIKSSIQNLRHQWLNIDRSSESNLASYSSKIEELIEKLNGSSKLDGDGYFKKSLSSLIKVLTCSCKLEEHKQEIEYHTHLISTEFLRIGFSIKELTGYNGIFSKILSKNIEFDEESGNVYTRFPLPPEIEKYRGSEDFKSEVSTFLEKRTFKEQFEGIHTIYKKSREGRFIIRVEEVSINEDIINFEIYGTTIHTNESLTIDLSTWEDHFIESFNKFKEVSNSIFLSIPIKFRSQEIGYQVAMDKANETLNWLNHKFGSGGRIFNEEYYLIYPSGSGRVVWSNKKLSIPKNRLSDITENDPIFSLRGNLELKIKNKLINNDKILDNAKSNKSIEDKIINYWRFLESYFIGNRYRNLDKGEKIIKDISKILLNKEVNTRKLNLGLIIINTFINSDTETIKLNISPVKLRLLLNNADLDNLEELQELQDYYFLNEIFTKYKNIQTIINLDNSEAYYKQLFLELYEQRNVVMHRGEYCESTITKLLREIPRIISRFRIIILEKLNSNENGENIEDIITSLRNNY